MMTWVFLSPHLDDVALSAGGLVWELVRSGQDVLVWTICAGDPPPGAFSPFAQLLHDRWNVGREAVAIRRQEDRRSCALLGASHQHFDIPDCIYRRSITTGIHLYPDENALWVPIHPDEEPLLEKINKILRERLVKLDSDIRLVSPLALGGHVDHRLTRSVAERTGLPLHYYADYPYVVRVGALEPGPGMKSQRFKISPDGMLAWQNAISAHESQISTFWGDLEVMRAEIESYYRKMDGVWIGG